MAASKRKKRDGGGISVKIPANHEVSDTHRLEATEPKQRKKKAEQRGGRTFIKTGISEGNWRQEE